MNNWHQSIDTFGWRVVFPLGDREVWFKPNGHGRVKAIYAVPTHSIDAAAIRDCCEKVRDEFETKRFSHEGSRERGSLCGRICSALNEAGIRPVPKAPR